MKFSLRDSLIKLKGKNYDPFMANTLESLTNNLNEDQLRILLMTHGLKVDNKIIKLYFYENVGFRCMNEREDVYGKKPICKNIEKFMNDLYVEAINTTYKTKWVIGDVMEFSNAFNVNVVIAKYTGGEVMSGENMMMFEGYVVSPIKDRGTWSEFSYDSDDMESIELNSKREAAILNYPKDEDFKEFFPEEWKKAHLDRFDL